MLEVITIGKKNQIVIPKKIRKRLGLHEGRKLLLEVEENRMVLVALPQSIEEIAGMGKGLYEDGYLDHLRREWDEKNLR